MSFWEIPLIAALLFSSGCRKLQLSGLPATPADNEYLDLAGGTLRITVPYYKSAGHLAKLSATKEENGTLTVTQPDLAGFEVSRFLVQRHRSGEVQLKFISTHVTIDGRVQEQSGFPSLPFALPLKRQHIRLIYFVRSSHADHDMAIASANDRRALDAFTSRLKLDPEICPCNGPVNCIWVPHGTSVRPE